MQTDWSMKLSTHLKSAVKQAGGNKFISEKTGISLSTLNKTLSGGTKPSFENIAKIAIACNISLAQLEVQSNHQVHNSDNKYKPHFPEIDKSGIVEKLKDSGLDFHAFSAAIVTVTGILENQGAMVITNSVSKEQLVLAIGRAYLSIKSAYKEK